MLTLATICGFLINLSSFIIPQSERSRKGAENELADLSDRVGELTANNNTLASQRRKAEQELQSVQSELEEAITDARNNEDKAKKAISDVRYFCYILNPSDEKTFLTNSPETFFLFFVQKHPGEICICVFQLLIVEMVTVCTI